MRKITLLFVCAGILIAAPSSYGKKGYLEAVYGDPNSKEIKIFNNEKPKTHKNHHPKKVSAVSYPSHFRTNG